MNFFVIKVFYHKGCSSYVGERFSDEKFLRLHKAMISPDENARPSKGGRSSAMNNLKKVE